jgi:hypothetical protein
VLDFMVKIYFQSATTPHLGVADFGGSGGRDEVELSGRSIATVRKIAWHCCSAKRSERELAPHPARSGLGLLILLLGETTDQICELMPFVSRTPDAADYTRQT